MANIKTKDKLSTALIYGLFGILIIAFVLYHTFSSLFFPYVTEEAIQTTIDKTITADCYTFRKENVIKSDNSGFKVSSVANGSRVAKNSTVLKIFKNESDVSKANDISKLEDLINKLEEINKQNSIYSGDLDTISEQIQSNIFKMITSVNNESFSNVLTYTEKLKYYMAQAQLATDREENYNSVIEIYKKELNNLKKGFNPEISTLKSEYAGYYVNNVDGFENAVDYDKVDQIDVNTLKNIKAKKTNSNDVCKVISENEWYIATVVNTSEIKGLDKGDKVKIHTSLASAEELSVTVAAINKDDSSGKAALVLSCMKMNDELAMLRHKSMKIVLNSFTGLRVNTKAVRVKDGQKGVYILLGSIIKYKPINIVYSTNEYVIVDSKNLENQLKIYDDVVVKGKGLDG